MATLAGRIHASGWGTLTTVGELGAFIRIAVGHQCAQAVVAVALSYAAFNGHAQTNAPSVEQPAGQAPRVDIYAKQGYPKDQSTALLDPEVRGLLDVALRLYREPGLFTNRSKALQALGVAHTSRRWNDQKPVEGGYRAYVDSFAKEGLFARPAWTGEYNYNGKREGRLEQWHALIRIKVDYTQDCLSSRAVEGYLDLVLDPGIKGFAHPVTERLRRHEVPFAEPYAPPLTPITPMLWVTFSHGCLAELGLASIFDFKDISDDHAHN